MREDELHTLDDIGCFLHATSCSTMELQGSKADANMIEWIGEIPNKPKYGLLEAV